MKTSKRITTTFIVLALALSVPAWAGSTQSSNKKPGAKSQAYASCGTETQVINNARNTYNKETGIAMKAYTPTGNLAAQACIKSLLNIGTSLGEPVLSWHNVLNSLGNMACSAAKNFESHEFNKLNRALPSINGTTVTVHRGPNSVYKERQASQAVNKIWNALN